jgi:hypothetical protein
MTLASSKSKYARNKYDAIKTVPHIVLLGTISLNTLKNFLGEYFHTDHGETLKHCVIMVPTNPDPDIEIWLQKESYAKEVTILEGASSSDDDLLRC